MMDFAGLKHADSNPRVLKELSESRFGYHALVLLVQLWTCPQSPCAGRCDGSRNRRSRLERARIAGSGVGDKLSGMTPEERALAALLEMGEYSGENQTFLRESVTRVRGQLNCSEEESERVISHLRNTGQIDCDITQGGELPAGENIPEARWYWHIP